MKKYILLLSCLCGNAMAEYDSLPPVIDNSSYPTVAPTANTAAPAPNALYEMMVRLDQLQAQVQQLTGKVEEQGNQIAELKKQQTTLHADFDERLQSIERGTGTTPTVKPVSETPTETPAVTGTPTEMPPSTSDIAPADLPAPPAVPTEPIEPEVATGNATPAPVARPAPKPEVQASGGEKQAYQKAYSALRSGHTDESIEQFKAYLSQYPTGGYADVAHYYLGEAYRVKPDIDSAKQSYNTVLEKYPNSAKIADALLRLGTIEADQKNVEKAREYLTRVTSEFPNTPSAHAAEKKLTQMSTTKN